MWIRKVVFCIILAQFSFYDFLPFLNLLLILFFIFSFCICGALEHFGYKAPDLSYFYMSIWFDLSWFENWFIDRRGGFMGVFTRNHFFRLPASASPESDSSDNDDDTSFGPQNSSGWIVNTPFTKDTNIPQGPGATTTATSHSPTIMARPPASGSSSGESTIILGSASPEAMEVSSGSNGTSSFPNEQSTVPSPAIEVTVSTLSTNFHVSSASTVVVNSTGHSYLPQLSYGDVKEHLPSVGVPDFASVPNASSTSHGPLKVAQLMLGLPPTTNGPLKMVPSGPMSISTSLVSKEKPPTTKSFTLGTNAFGNLGTPEQQISWLRQSAELVLQEIQTPKHTSSGCSQPHKQILPKDVSSQQFSDTPLDNKN